MKKRTSLKNTSLSRRKATRAGLLIVAAGMVPGAAHAIGAAGRNAARGRRNIARRKVAFRFRAANAAQRAAALANARKAQVKLKQKWVKSPPAQAYAVKNNLPKAGFGGYSKALNAAPVGMGQVVRDLKAPPIQAVKVPKTPGSELGAAVIPVDLRTGGLVGNNVVEMARVPRAGTSVSNQVKAAVRDAAIEGNPGEFVRRDIVVASL